MSGQMTGTQDLISTPSIQRTFFGGDQAVTFQDFYASRGIQDYEAGMNIVQFMLAGEDPFLLNDPEPRFYQEYRIINRDALEAQVALAQLQIHGEAVGCSTRPPRFSI